MSKQQLNPVAKALTYTKGLLSVKSFIRVTNYNIDQLYVDVFWNSLKEKSWIYLSPELIDMIGFQGVASNRMSHCLRLLEKISKLGIEYKLVPSTHEIVCLPEKEGNNSEVKSSRGGHNKKYYILSSRCFKKLLIKANTKYSDKIHDYYLNLEELFFDYTDYQNKYRLAKAKRTTEQLMIESKKAADALEEKLRVAESKNLRVSAFIHNMELNQKNDNLYIVTTRQYSQYNLFKVGKTVNIKNRIATYNTGRVEDDSSFVVWKFKCHSARDLEVRVRQMLGRFAEKSSKELYMLHYDYLKMFIERIASGYDEETDAFNDFVRDHLIDAAKKEPAIVGPLVEETNIEPGAASDHDADDDDGEDNHSDSSEDTIESLSAMSKKDLIIKARIMKIKGGYKMKKQDIVDAILSG